MEIEDYLRQAQAQGEKKGEGVFTISGEKARTKLAQSVPAWLADPWSAITTLMAALRLGYGLKDPSMSPFVIQGSMFSTVMVGLALTFCREDLDQGKLSELASLVEGAGERPFGGTSPLQVLLSRAVMAFTKIGVACHFCLGSAHPVWKQPEVDEPSMQSLAKNGAVFGNVISVTLSHHASFLAFHQVDSKSRSYALRAWMEGCHQPLAPARVWDKDGIGRDVLNLFGQWHAGSWFDYRTRSAVLLESFHHGPADSPMRVSGHLQLDPGEVDRVNDQLSAWARFLGRKHDVLLRHWGEGLPQITSTTDDRVPVMAIFAVGLSESRSQVELFGWGRVRQTHYLKNCRNGLRGLVWWPGLKQDLYGDDWVRDKEFERAEQWVEQHARQCFDRLRDELDWVKGIICSEHARSGYVGEVEKRLREWLG